MTYTEDLEATAKEFEEAILFNKPIIHVLAKANERQISIHIESNDSVGNYALRVRFERRGRLCFIERYIDPEVVLTSIFYPRPKEDEV